jgi:hypothetical protein
MRNHHYLLLLLSLFSLSAIAQNHRLWYAAPAAHWLEALPVGNSSLDKDLKRLNVTIQ